MNNKSQSAAEFLILIGAVLLFFTLFLIVIYNKTYETSQEKETIIIKDIALDVQDEINLASKASNGYYREFTLREDLDYSITLAGNSVYIKTEKNAVSYPIIEVQGSVKRGKNIIKKENDKVYLN